MRLEDAHSVCLSSLKVRQQPSWGTETTQKPILYHSVLDAASGNPMLNKKTKGSLPVALGRPVVPLVIGLGLLGEQHLVEAERVGRTAED